MHCPASTSQASDSHSAWASHTRHCPSSPHTGESVEQSSSSRQAEQLPSVQKGLSDERDSHSRLPSQARHIPVSPSQIGTPFGHCSSPVQLSGTSSGPPPLPVESSPSPSPSPSPGKSPSPIMPPGERSPSPFDSASAFPCPVTLLPQAIAANRPKKLVKKR